MNLNIVQIATFINVWGFLLLICIKFYILVHTPSYLKSGRVAGLWLVIYLFFLFVLRFFQLVGVGTQDQLRIISGFAVLIPLFFVIVHLWFNKKIEELPTIEQELQGKNVTITIKK